MKNVLLTLIVFTALLSGCMSAEERLARQQQWQQYVNQCNARGGVIYNDQCMTPEAAAAQQQRDFQAREAEKNREAMLQAACISRGGVWGGFQCIGGSNDVNVNIRRY